MNTERLLALYDRVADAPDAVLHLRQFILDLAVQGKLVEQNPHDPSPSDLPNRIHHEYGNTRISKSIANPTANRKTPIEKYSPFEIPKSWYWISTGETGHIFSGNSSNQAMKEKLYRNKSGYPYIMTKDVGYGFDQLNYENNMKVSHEQHNFKIAKRYSVLICAEGGSAGRKIGITDRPICFGNKLIANEMRKSIIPRYVLIVYMSNYFYHEFSIRMKGVISGISIKKFLEIPFPLPPLSEQHRIVKKVDEMMTQCDEIEASRNKRESIRAKLTVSSLGRLVDSKSSEEEFRNHAGFVIDNISSLTINAEQIKLLKKTILDLAVRGKLVEQNPRDKPASELLKNGRVEKCKVNSGWLVSDIGSLLDFKYGKSKKISECLKHGPIPVFGSNGIVGYCETALVDRSSIIIGRKGSAGAVNKSSGPAWITDVAYYVLAPIYFDKDYLYWALKGVELDSHAKGVKPGLSRSDAYKIPLRVPPLSEQHRIVKRVDELMEQCNKLEKNISKRSDRMAKLLDSALA
ncbi:MAG: restriction endonuclease subunit S [Bacteroidetes bacterium]|nr:restriction endonuclease subunit S [Bacteroidota bacterium]MCY4227131.1 restriction endonuclease subunit S [Gammaproteobacteria bacterium]